MSVAAPFVVVGRGDIALDGEGEPGQMLVTDDPPELALGLEHPAGGPAQGHLARLPALDVPAGAPPDPFQLSIVTRAAHRGTHQA